MMLNIQALPALSDNYIWLIRFGDHQAAVVDPGDAQLVMQYLEKQELTLSAVLVTHQCRDHVNGIQPLLAKHPAPVYGPAKENIPCMDHPVKEGDIVPLGDIKLTAMDTPGHTHGHVSYYGENSLFCGDTLFAGGCGRLYTRDPALMYASLNKIKTLPKNTYIYCAHEYTVANLRFGLTVEPDNQDIRMRQEVESNKRAQGVATIPSTLGLELKTNPFLRCHIPEVMAAAEKFSGKSLTSEVDVFTVLRYWKDTFA